VLAFFDASREGAGEMVVLAIEEVHRWVVVRVERFPLGFHNNRPRRIRCGSREYLGVGRVPVTCLVWTNTRVVNN